MKAKSKALDMLQKKIDAKYGRNSSVFYTNGDSKAQAKLRKQPYPPGDKNK